MQLPDLQFPLYVGDPQGLSSLRNSLPIEQLDNYSVWTQLSFETAEMLYEIDRLITACAEDLLGDKLADMDMAVSKQASTICTIDEGMHRNLYLLTFSVSELMELVFDRMRLDYYHHTLTYSPEALRELFLLYLLSRNNVDKKIADGKTYGTMTLGLQPSRGLHAPESRADVVQRSDILLFPCLDILPREGSIIEIRPRYHRGVFDERNDNYYSDVSYSIADLPEWLHWDPTISGWSGRIPMYSELRGKSTDGRQIIDGGRDGPYAVLNLLRLEVKATLVVRHSSLSVGLKRTVRARLTLKVVPWYAAKHTPTPLSPWQHEIYSSNNSVAVDSKFQEYLTKCQEALESRPEERRMNRDYGPRIIDEVDCKASFGQDVHIPHDLTTKPGGAPRNLHSGDWNDGVFLYHPDHVQQSRTERHGEPRRTKESQPSSKAGSAYELQEYSASDDGFSFSPIEPLQCRAESQFHKPRSVCSKASRRSSNSDKHHTRGLQRTISASDESQLNGEIEDYYHSEDSHELATDIFNSRERDGRDDSLHYASPELHKIAQLLHQSNLQSNRTQRLDVSQGRHETPSKASGHSKRSNAASIDSENRRAGEEDAHVGETDKETEDMESGSLSPSLKPYITCLFNRFAPLRDLRTTSSSSGSTSSSLLSGGESVEIGIAAPYAMGRNEDSSDEDAETVRLEDYRRFDSGCYMADNEAEKDNNVDITDCISPRPPGSEAEDTIPLRVSRSGELVAKIIRRGSSGSMSSDAPTLQMPSPRETPKLVPQSRIVSMTELLPYPAISDGLSPPYLAHRQGDAGPWRMESFDEVAVDPSVRREQALLWRVLANKENVDAVPKKDPKLEAEELKGLWEVLKYEARQKRRDGVSEETFGVESGEEDFASEGEGEGEGSSASSSRGGDGEMEDTWNFGC